MNAVAAAGQLDNTYFFSTSDHGRVNVRRSFHVSHVSETSQTTRTIYPRQGYRFGQFRMPMGKWNVYENDIRIPMVVRGPGIKPNSSFDYLASNVDVMPTILGLAGVERYDKGKAQRGERGYGSTAEPYGVVALICNTFLPPTARRPWMADRLPHLL